MQMFAYYPEKWFARLIESWHCYLLSALGLECEWMLTKLQSCRVDGLEVDEGEQDGDGEGCDDDREREEGADLDEGGGEHFDGGEDEDCGEAVVQEAEFDEEMGEEEVERAESHDGHDVGGVGEEGVAGDGQHGGDGIECEYDVGEFYGDEGEAEDGGEEPSVFDDEEVILTEADGVELGEPLDPNGGCFEIVRRLREEQAYGGDEEDDGEEVGDPVEAGEEGEAGGDEGSAEEDGTGYSPEEDARLADRGDLKEAEEEEEDEEIVDGEGLLDGVAGEVLGG